MKSKIGKVTTVSLLDLRYDVPVVEGIYFSHKTGKFFEAVVKRGKIKPKYACGGFGPEVPSYIFKIQRILYYDLIMEYEK